MSPPAGALLSAPAGAGSSRIRVPSPQGTGNGETAKPMRSGRPRSCDDSLSSRVIADAGRRIGIKLSALAQGGLTYAADDYEALCSAGGRQRASRARRERSACRVGAPWSAGMASVPFDGRDGDRGYAGRSSGSMPCWRSRARSLSILPLSCWHRSARHGRLKCLLPIVAGGRPCGRAVRFPVPQRRGLLILLSIDSGLLLGTDHLDLLVRVAGVRPGAHPLLDGSGLQPAIATGRSVVAQAPRPTGGA